MSAADQISEALDKAVRASRGPGAVLALGDRSGLQRLEASGLRQRVPVQKPAEPDTIYDLASLTKVIATTTALMRLRDAGELRLDDSIAEYIPYGEFSGITIRHLLTHTSGLAAWNSYYTWATSLDGVFARCAEDAVVRAPGERWVYSDFGFMMLGRVVEKISGGPLDVHCKETIFDPLGMVDTMFKPPAELRARCAATEACPWRKRVIVGEVHDQNAYAVGGVAGHAGLFSTAADLAKFLQALLSGKIVSGSTLVEMTTMDKVPTYPWQGFGWLVDPWRSKAQGFLPGRTAFGHTGWTGTCLWADRDTGVFAILLGNTCHPSGEKRDNDAFRRIVYTPIAKTYYPDRTAAHTGLDRLFRQDYEAIEGKRIALLTNSASVDQYGRRILDVLKLWPGVDLRLLYSPEHGIAGQAEAGQAVANQSGPVPVISLYGDRKAPTEAELAGVDLFVVDLQDVGARYYTYVSTMKHCLYACSAARVPVLVLDRPNPLGGLVLEGPIAQTTTSDVCAIKVPVRHGMTMGEIAYFIARTELGPEKAKVSIHLLDNWEPERLFDECALPWIPPSPNIPTAQTALVYAGMCLFEGINLNEGRGTDAPFFQFGAPWLDATAIAHMVPGPERIGIDLESVVFTPKSIPGKASSPRFQDVECRGLRLHITNPRNARPFTAALTLLQAVRTRHAAELEFSPFFDTLAGGPDLRIRLQRGESATTITAAYAPALAAFDKSRPRLYEPWI